MKRKEVTPAVSSSDNAVASESSSSIAVGEEQPQGALGVMVSSSEAPPKKRRAKERF